MWGEVLRANMGQKKRDGSPLVEPAFVLEIVQELPKVALCVIVGRSGMLPLSVVDGEPGPGEVAE